MCWREHCYTIGSDAINHSVPLFSQDGLNCIDMLFLISEIVDANVMINIVFATFLDGIVVAILKCYSLCYFILFDIVFATFLERN
jgi:hypothetical protein